MQERDLSEGSLSKESAYCQVLWVNLFVSELGFASPPHLNVLVVLADIVDALSIFPLEVENNSRNEQYHAAETDQYAYHRQHCCEYNRCRFVRRTGRIVYNRKCWAFEPVTHFVKYSRGNGKERHHCIPDGMSPGASRYTPPPGGRNT